MDSEKNQGCLISTWGKIIIPQAISFILRLNGLKSLRNPNKHAQNCTSMQRGCSLVRGQECWLPLASSNSPISHLWLSACQKALDSESSLHMMGCFCGLAVPCFPQSVSQWEVWVAAVTVVLLNMKLRICFTCSAR